MIGRKLKDIKNPPPPDIEINQSIEPLSIKELCQQNGILEFECEPYGNYKAKIKLDILDRLKDKPNGNYVIIIIIIIK